MHRRDRTKIRKRGTVFQLYFWGKYEKAGLLPFKVEIIFWIKKSIYKFPLKVQLFFQWKNSCFFHIELETLSYEQNFSKSNYGDKLAGFCRISRSIGSGTLGCKFWQILFPTRTGRKWSTRVIPDSRKTGLSGFKCKIC